MSASTSEGISQRPTLPDPERLVNLTPHEIVLQATELPLSNDADNAGAVILRLPPEGTFARVDDKSSRLSEGCLNAGTGVVTVTRLRRSGMLKDLPPPAEGTRLVVSRLTALAARHRRDLVFPFSELRDPDGRIVGVRGLGAFRPSLALVQRYRDWRTRARADLAASAVGREWLTGVLFVAATALLSGFLALIPGAADNAVRHGWAGGGLAWTSWSSIACLIAGGWVLAIGAWRWRRRGEVLSERGTAYVIDEVAASWQHEEKESVLTDIRAGFARTLLVPGPGALDEAWDWQADGDSAARWDENVDRLVRSFWAVHYNDDQITRNALYTWAPWPVAMAFGARATALRRGLVLHVRQRPSYGAAGPRTELCLTEPAHDFLRTTPSVPLAESAPEHAVRCLPGQVMVTIETLPDQDASRRPRTSAARYAKSPGSAARPVLLLVIRTIAEKIGDIPLDLTDAPPVTIQVAARLARTILPTGNRPVTVAEWRLDSAVTPNPPLPWRAFPAAVGQLADWIIAESAARPDHVVLIASRMPQELAVGLGIQLAQLGHKWPRHAYPVYYARGLVVPYLRLGAESVPTQRS